jgi:hypothetical protein
MGIYKTFQREWRATGTGRPPPVMNRLGPSTLVEAGGQKLLFDWNAELVRGAVAMRYEPKS